MNASIMITGVGAVIGQGIIKSLQGQKTDYRLIGIDANPFSVGFQWTDTHHVVPRTDDPHWLDAVTDICNKENVVIILPGIEQDVKAFVKHYETIKNTHALPLLNSDDALRVGFDKWELYVFALHNNIKMPDTWLASEIQEASLSDFHYPLLLKPRSGMAGKGIYRVETIDDLKFWMKRVSCNEYILQEHQGSDNEEYTVSIFGFKDGKISDPFALRRKLNYGSTFEAETIEDYNLSAIVSSMAGKLNVVGPTNFQFRKKDDDYYLIEINPRFSSSTSIKSAFGFNEPLMAIKSFIEGAAEIKLELKTGKCFRYLSDSIVYT